MRLVLASSSPYRRALLSRLGVPFETAAPNVDESPHTGEAPAATALRLALEKAAAIAPCFGDAFIIGADQVADLDGRPLGKPGTRENTILQLRLCSGRTVAFHTGLCLLDAATGDTQHGTALNRVRFRRFSDNDIWQYLSREQPFDCTGGAKADGLGIVLIERFEGDDPNALIGLPLLLLADMLRKVGFSLP